MKENPRPQGEPVSTGLTLEGFDDHEGYCRNEVPCPRLADCWFERLPVEAYLRANFTPEEIGAMLTPAAPKLQSILEIVAQVRSRSETQG
jgi:hypothetical protein